MKLRFDLDICFAPDVPINAVRGTFALTMLHKWLKECEDAEVALLGAQVGNQRGVVEQEAGDLEGLR